jgi:hypothetical protein
MATPNKKRAFVCAALAVSSLLVGATDQALDLSFVDVRLDLAAANFGPFAVTVLINDTPR